MAIAIVIYLTSIVLISAAKLKQLHESEIQKLRMDGETVSIKLTAELNSVKHERDSTSQKVNWLASYIAICMPDHIAS